MDENYVSQLEERFVRYVQIDTQSDEASSQVPSTARQLDLLRLLQAELIDMGASDVVLTDYACLLATLPATRPADDLPVLAFLAHVDTAPAFNGTGVKPIVHRNYAGQPIVLPDDPQQILTVDNSPELRDKLGEDIVTASGTTLLGADDKAGVAIVMTLAAELLRSPDIPHGTLRVCFTTDEEVGRGMAHLKLEDLAADVAYTLDGESAGEIVYETFSADRAVVTITGVSTHAGQAKGKMVNAVRLASRLLMSLPQDSLTPETTQGREGFIYPYQIDGNAAEARLYFLLRDFEAEGLQAQVALLESACQAVRAAEPRARIALSITSQYRNMRDLIERDMRPVELARQAIRQAGLEPVSEPTRGGTDGARLTAMGVPTPNLFTGMHNYHGPLEWVSLQDMARATQVCLNLVQLWAAQ